MRFLKKSSKFMRNLGALGAKYAKEIWVASERNSGPSQVCMRVVHLSVCTFSLSIDSFSHRVGYLTVCGGPTLTCCVKTLLDIGTRAGGPAGSHAGGVRPFLPSPFLCPDLEKVFRSLLISRVEPSLAVWKQPGGCSARRRRRRW